MPSTGSPSRRSGIIAAMSDATPPTEPRAKRRFWQIHLSTAITLVFVASGLLWLNLHDQKHSASLVEYFGTENIYEVYGWPWIVHNYAYSRQGELFCAQISWQSAALNVAVAAVVLTGGTVASEFLIRRRRPQP
jgi:hypothetical protein